MKKTIKEIDIYTECYDDHIECDWRHLPFRSRLAFALGLVFGQKITVWGKFKTSITR
jgi:hypothetical protein